MLSGFMSSRRVLVLKARIPDVPISGFRVYKAKTGTTNLV